MGFIGSAVFSFFYIEYYKTAFIYHCTISEINAFIPTGKGRCKIYYFVIVFTIEITHFFTQIPLLRDTVYQFDFKLGAFVPYFR